MAEKAGKPDVKTESYTNSVEPNLLTPAVNQENVQKQEQDRQSAPLAVNSPLNLNDFPKKKSAFQITSVKPASLNENDGDSMDDLDESHTEDISSLDYSKTTDIENEPSSDDTISNVHIDESDHHDGKPIDDANQNKEKESSTRFRVVKIESQEPFVRGRWKCFDFLDPPIAEQGKKTDQEREVGSGNSSAASSIHYVHGEDDPSKNPLDGTVFIQGDNQQFIVASPTRSMLKGPGLQDFIPGPQENMQLQAKSKQQQKQPQQQQYTPQNGTVSHSSSVSADYPGSQTVAGSAASQSVPQQTSTGPSAGSQTHFTSNAVPASPSSKNVQSAGQSAQPVSLPQTSNSSQQHAVPPDTSSTQVKQQKQQQQQQQQQQHQIGSEQSAQQPQQSQLQQPMTNTGSTTTGQPKTDFNASSKVAQPATPASGGPAGQQVLATGASNQPPIVVTTDSTSNPVGASSTSSKDYVKAPVVSSVSQENASSANTGKKPSKEPESSAGATTLKASVRPTLSVAENGQVAYVSSRDSSDMSSVESVLRETLQGTMSNISPQPGSPTSKHHEGADGAGSSTVAIDNKIEAAMDLVKSHLMFAVREEVEVLKEQIKGLIETNKQLQIENQALRQTAPAEVLASISQTVSPDEPPPSSS